MDKPSIYFKALPADRENYLLNLPMLTLMGNERTPQINIVALHLLVPGVDKAEPKDVYIALPGEVRMGDAVEDNGTARFELDYSMPRIERSEGNKKNAFALSWGDFELQICVHAEAVLNLNTGLVLLKTHNTSVWVGAVSVDHRRLESCSLEHGIGKAVSDHFKSSRLAAYDVMVAPFGEKIK